MINENNEKPAQDTNEPSAIKPEPETLHTPDPQKKMDGPVSSSIKSVGEIFDTDETKDEEDEK